MIMGFKGIPHNLMYLANDDVDTPTAMVGKKMVPILELGRQGHDDHEVRVDWRGARAGAVGLRCQNMTVKAMMKLRKNIS